MEARVIARRLLALIALSATLLLSPAAFAKNATAFDADVARVKAVMLADPARAIALARISREEVRKTADPEMRRRQIATSEWLIGEGFNRIGATQKALLILRSAVSAMQGGDEHTQLHADILLALGSALTDSGNVTEALTTLQEAHELYLGLGQARGQAKALILIAMMYDRARDHENALRYFGQAIDGAGGDPGLTLAIYSGRGAALNSLERHRAAIDAYGRALTIARQMNSKALEAQLLGEIGDLQLKLGQVAAARRTIDKALPLAQAPSMAAFRDRLYDVAAAVALRQGDLATARRLVERRFQGVDLSTTVLADRDAHDVAYRTFLATHDNQRALAHLAALKRLDDQATEIARSNSAALAAARFDYANQELRITRLKAADLAKTVAFERSAARTERMIFIGVALTGGVVVGLLVFGLVTIRRSRNEVRAANDGLEASNAELAKALRAKTEFLATTSHEIRTPLNGILGMTQIMLRDTALDAAMRERLSVVHGAGTTMRALVDDILDVAKIETGKMTIEALPMDLHATIADAARLWRDPAIGKGLAFRTHLSEAPRWIVGDPARLRQIVFNLLSNAVKFTHQGSVDLTIAGIDGQLRLEVTDTGIGIAEEAHDLIFESFRQADTGTTRQFGGTGLGLSICRNLARAMGGDVLVRSRLGEGATFTLDLPLIEAEAPDVVVERPAVLIVEANPITQAMLRQLFVDLGSVAFAAPADVPAAIARLRPHRLLIDSATLGDAPLAPIVAAAETVPIALLTQKCDEIQRLHYLSSGVTHVIERPVTKKALAATVASLGSPLVLQAA